MHEKDVGQKNAEVIAFWYPLILKVADASQVLSLATHKDL